MFQLQVTQQTQFVFSTQLLALTKNGAQTTEKNIFRLHLVVEQEEHFILTTLVLVQQVTA